jgi:putative ABC transport system permease protein
MGEFLLAFRLLKRSPGSTSLIILLLAIGIGATTAIFNLYDVILLRSLPVPHPEQLVGMTIQFPKLKPRDAFPYVFYQALNERAATLAYVFAETYDFEHFRWAEPGPAQEITVYGVTPTYFRGLGAQPLAGRYLLPEDDRSTSGPTAAVLSYDFARTRFGNDTRTAVGRNIVIEKRAFFVAGVMRRAFLGLSADHGPDAWIPLQAYVRLKPGIRLDDEIFAVAGRLRRGASLVRTQAECLTIWRAVMEDYYRNVEKLASKDIATMIHRGMQVNPFGRGESILREYFNEVVQFLMAAGAVMMLMLAVNVSGIVLVRAVARRRDMAVQLALGAAPLRLARQWIAESVLLAAFGAMGGLIFAVIAMPLSLRLLPPVRDLSTQLLSLSIDTRLHYRVFFSLLALAAGVGLMMSASPAVIAARSTVDRVLRTARASNTFRARQFLIGVQIALCTFLLATAALLARSFERLRATPSGLADSSVATFRCELQSSIHRDRTVEAVMQRVREIPGVLSVAISQRGVLQQHGTSANVAPAGERLRDGDIMLTNTNSVSQAYFETMGIRILAGRDFLPGDLIQPKQGAQNKAIVNEAFVRHFFPGSDGLGQRFGFASLGGIAAPEWEIVGVVSDSKYRSLREPTRPMVYSPFTGDSEFTLNVRSEAPPESILHTLAQAIGPVAPDLTILESTTLAREVNESTAPDRTMATFALLFGGAAILLAGIGVYGLLAYSVLQRRKEIGIRIALGALPAQVAQFVSVQILVITVFGIGAGLGATVLIGPALRALLYGIPARDPFSLALAAALVLLIAASATVLPTWNALRTDPAETLRAE